MLTVYARLADAGFVGLVVLLHILPVCRRVGAARVQLDGFGLVQGDDLASRGRRKKARGFRLALVQIEMRSDDGAAAVCDRQDFPVHGKRAALFETRRSRYGLSSCAFRLAISGALGKVGAR